ncbi:MAG: SpoIVB peptidase S55 domain-containing protein [Candidatus Caldatribacteriota bacterium]|nr:SpoIVB peptidase S55 domain-containing protein [Candidatus Caldatribacteriota bacterium]
MKIKLNKIICIKIIFILLILFSMGINLAFSQTVFMPVSEISPGMKGIGKTVFHGTQIEIFQVDIIDIVKGEGGISHFILANLSGDKIEESGGISAGMSGSPVYIDDRLIGAVSYAWEMSEHNLCLITPIQEMLRIFNLPYDNYQTTAQEYKINNFLCFAGEKANKIIMKNTMENNSFSELAGREEIIFCPVVSPIIINGIKGRTLERLSSSLKKFNLIPIQGIGLNENNDINFQEVGERPSNKIEAGSAIGIQLTRGDVNITSIGTVTYREGDMILALGHPFLKKGEVSFLLSAVYVYHSFPNIVMPFKLGAPLNLVGKIVQDREAGILAILNSYPRIIPLKIKVTNINTGLSYQTGVQIINDYDLLEPLVSNITVQAIDNALDRIGAGTAQIEIEIKGEREGQELLRKNMCYSSDDIAIKAITEIPEIIALIVNNYFEMVNLTGINIDIKIDNKKKIGKIEEIVLEDSSIKPGDYLKAKIKIRPFRGELIEKMLTIQIPSDIPPGEALLMVNGGGELANQQEDFVNNGKQDYKSLEEIFKSISDRPRGNQIIGEVIIYSDELTSEKETSEDGPKKKEEEENLLISKIETDMVIEGYLEIPFTIEK